MLSCDSALGDVLKFTINLTLQRLNELAKHSDFDRWEYSVQYVTAMMLLFTVPKLYPHTKKKSTDTSQGQCNVISVIMPIYYVPRIWILKSNCEAYNVKMVL